MIYHSGIDNQTADRWGINLEDAYLFTWIHGLPVWADRSVVDGKDFYHGARNSVKKALPLASDKPDTIYRQFKRMQAAGIIEHEKIGVKDYIHITPKGKEWNFAHTSEKNPTLGLDGQLSEKNPDKLGKKSESGSEKNPTYYSIKEDYNNNDKEEGANAPRALQNKVEFFDLNGQKTREVGTKGGGAKVKKTPTPMLDLREQFPTVDDFIRAFMLTGEFADKYGHLDLHKLYMTLETYNMKGNQYKSWILGARTFILRDEKQFIKTNGTATNKSQQPLDELTEFFQTHKIAEGGFGFGSLGRRSGSRENQ